MNSILRACLLLNKTWMRTYVAYVRGFIPEGQRDVSVGLSPAMFDVYKSFERGFSETKICLLFNAVFIAPTSIILK